MTPTIRRRDFLAALGMAAATGASGQEPPRPDFTLNIGPVSVEPKPGKIVKTTGYNGSIAHLAIWNRLLSQDEIASIWTEGDAELKATPMYHSFA